MGTIYQETLKLIVRERVTNLHKTFAYQVASIAFMALCLLLAAHTDLYLIMSVPFVVISLAYGIAYARARMTTENDRLKANLVQNFYALRQLNNQPEQETV